jgi:hypothetical protein
VARVHCLDCGDHVVVDPMGRCPDGHHVGAAGARVAGAIGSDVPHPEEPEPWVARVDLDPELDAAEPEPAAREVRPMSIPSAPAEPAADVDPSPARTEDLLRELHELGELDAASTPAAVSVPSTPAPVRRVPSAPAKPAAGPAPAADASVEELSALEAAVQALSTSHDDRSVHPNGDGQVDGTASSNGNGHDGGNGHQASAPEVSDELRELLQGDELVRPAAEEPDTRTPTAGEPSPPPPTAPVVTPPPDDGFDDLFGELDHAEPPAPLTPTSPPSPFTRATPAAPPAAPVPPTPAAFTADRAPARWAVLADVADLADRAAAVETTPPAPAATEGPAPVEREPVAARTGGIDLSNFTAKGGKVGGRGRRRRTGR